MKPPQINALSSAEPNQPGERITVMLHTAPLSRLPVAPAFRARQLIAEYRTQLAIEHAAMAKGELMAETAIRRARAREAEDAMKRFEMLKDRADATEVTIGELEAQ